MYRVLRAVYERTGEIDRSEGRSVQIERVAHWRCIGEAYDAQDAKRRYPPVWYGYALVMERIE